MMISSIRRTICLIIAALVQGHAFGVFSAAGATGADAPWITYQAEDGTGNGQRLASRTGGEIANEAIGRACVKISTAGQFVEWKVSKPANAVVVRACVPDAPTGGGADYTLSLAINGKFRQKITVSSHHAWLYGREGNPQNNSPSAGPPHHFFDESRAFIEGPPINPGDTLRLFKDSSDAAAWYVVDLIDLEKVDPPGKKPDGFLSVTDFGAVPNDNQDDSAALKACVEKAKTEHKGVWIPAGTFHQSEPLTIDHVNLRGAGPWYTRLTAVGDPKAPTFAGNVGLHLNGQDIDAADLFIEGTLTARMSTKQHGLTGSGERFHLENIWIEHTDTGGWIGSSSNGVIRRCRFRNTYADGLNINNNSRDVVVEQNHSRGNGDDGIAEFSNSDHAGAQGFCRNIILRHNTSEGQWWGNGMAIYGGEGIVAEQNLINSANSGAGFVFTTGFESWPANGVRVVDNVILDCGGSAWKQPWGAIHVYVPGKDIKNLLIQNNTVRRSTADAIRLAGSKSPGIMQITLSQNSVETAGGSGIHILDSAHGAVTLKGNRITGNGPGKAPILNQAPPARLNYREERP